MNHWRGRIVTISELAYRKLAQTPAKCEVLEGGPTPPPTKRRKKADKPEEPVPAEPLAEMEQVKPPAPAFDHEAQA